MGDCSRGLQKAAEGPSYRKGVEGEERNRTANNHAYIGKLLDPADAHVPVNDYIRAIWGLYRNYIEVYNSHITPL